MKVLKFGGTSIGDAARMLNVAEIVTKQKTVLVVLSAVNGTTNTLQSIVEAVRKSDSPSANSLIKEMNEFYDIFTDELFSTDSSKTHANEYISTVLSEVSEIVQKKFTTSLQYRLLAMGEMISTELFHLLLNEHGVKNRLLNALDFLRLDQSNNPDENFLTQELSKLTTDSSNNLVMITQGTICRNAFGEISNLNRGGSDYSASLFGAALNCEEIQIWTEIDGMHNNDPRFVENTSAIRELSFDEAAELAYFGAKILHPSSIKPARKQNIPVKLLSGLDVSATGTIISSNISRGCIKAIASKAGITAIKIRSSEMLEAPGFLRRIFEIFELYQTSIDMITTSEVAVSLTVDDTQHLPAIIETLREFGSVEIDENLSLVCIVGGYIAETTGLVSKVIRSLEDIPIRMISYGGSAHNISVLVSEEHKVKALNALHKRLLDV